MSQLLSYVITLGVLFQEMGCHKVWGQRSVLSPGSLTHYLLLVQISLTLGSLGSEGQLRSGPRVSFHLQAVGMV